MTGTIIFDCDGTLVDTEYLSALSLTQALKPYGVIMTPEAFRDEFMGVANRKIMDVLSQRYSVALPLPAISPVYTKAMFAGMNEHMHILPGSVAAVRRLKDRYRIAVASNGTRAVVLEELRIAGYLEFIPESDIFTGGQVAHPKPAPDLFLYAAAAMKAEPSACVVVEDSLTGTHGGVAAGMRVVGYTGFAHDPDSQRKALEKAGCFKVISHLDELEPALL